VKDAAGAIAELRCTADLTTRAGGPNSDKKVKGTIHWVSASHSISAEVRLYDRLFTVAEPAAEEDFLKVVNPQSLEVITARLESSLANAVLEDRFQFERVGYFALDVKDSASGKLVFNRTISLKDNWAKAPGAK
ncbi:MAG: glutamine--tRNA ligase, partial [Rariglobus sp.]